MKRVALACAALLAAVPLRAAQKSGGAFEIPQDSVGASGRVGLASPGGFRLDQTIGASFQGTAMSGPSGWAVSPGLWGGASALRSAAAENVLFFGDPASPARLTVPANALPSDWVIFFGDDPLARPLAVSAAAVRRANDNLSSGAGRFTRPLDGKIWEILVLDESGRRIDALLAVPATLSFPYRDADGDGVVDGTQPPVRAATLAVWWLDEAHSLWVKVPDGAIDPVLRRVSAPIRHFSVYTVMGAPDLDPADAFAFPVPWRPFGPNAGAGAGQSGTLAGGITFSNLPSAAKIRIYTLNGELVRELTHEDGLPQATWDVRNSRGDDVQSGTYLYVVESGGRRKTGKLAVIR